MPDRTGGDRPEYDALLVDGTVVHLRVPTAADRPALLAMHERLSRRSAYFRYFSLSRTAPGRYLDAVLAPHERDLPGLMALVADRPVAIASYERLAGGDEADVAFLVDDEHQGLGVSTLLLEALAADAARRGITRFVAEVLPENAAMLDVFAAAGFAAAPRYRDGTVRVEFPLAPTETLLAAVGERERRADARSIARLLTPRSVAVLCAGRPGDLGRRIATNLTRYGFPGEVTVADSRRGVAPTALTAGADLAILAVPTEAVLATATGCADAGVANLVVTTGGFSEAGPDGAEREAALVRLARRAGMRLVGPQSLGVINTAAGTALYAAAVPRCPLPGSVGILSHSQALGAALLAETARRGIGVSTFVSGGNTADVSGNDLLLYWEQDEATDVVVLYLERFGNPRKFARIARRVARRKPVVVIASGQSAAGARAASPPRDPAPTEPAAMAALLAQTGAIGVPGVEELFPLLEVLLSQPLPRGRRVAVVGNSAGASALTADAAVAAGLDVPELSGSTQAALRALLPSAATVANPVDLLERAHPQEYSLAVSTLLDAGDVDALLVTHTVYPGVGRPGVAAAVDLAARHTGKPVVAAHLGGRQPRRRPTRAGVPGYPFPETAARALARASAYASWRARPAGTVPTLPGVDAAGTARALRAHLSTFPAGADLASEEASDLLARYGIRTQSPPPDSAGTSAGTVHLRLELAQDPLFGPVVSLGSAGLGADLFGDVATRILPLTDLDAADLVRSLHCAPLLTGHAGRPPLAVPAVEELIARVGLLAEHREIAELRLDPVVVTADAALVTAVRLRVAPAVRAPSSWLRRLR